MKRPIKKELVKRDYVRTHIWSVEWKDDRLFRKEWFRWISNFCMKYADYKEEQLLSRLVLKPYRYEDDKVIIGRAPMDKNWYRFNEHPDFDRVYFWDTRFENIDWNESYAWVITRMLERGRGKSWEELIRFYGKDIIMHAIRNEICVWEEQVDIQEIADYFNLAFEDTYHYHATLKRKEYLLNLTDNIFALRKKQERLMEKFMVIQSPAVPANQLS